MSKKNIMHFTHAHYDTNYDRKKCRQQILEGGQPYVNEKYVIHLKELERELTKA